MKVTDIVNCQPIGDNHRIWTKGHEFRWPMCTKKASHSIDGTWLKGYFSNQNGTLVIDVQRTPLRARTPRANSAPSSFEPLQQIAPLRKKQNTIGIDKR